MENENNNTIKTTLNRKHCYRNLLNRIETIQESEDVGINIVNDIHEILKEVNTLNDECDISEKEKHPDITLLDTIVLSSTSSVLVKCIEAVDILTVTYEPAEFSAKIIDAIKSDNNEKMVPKDFLKLLEDARSVINEVPRFSFLFGTYDFTKLPKPKERKTHKRQAQEKVQKKELIHVTNVDQEEKGIEATVNFMFDVLEYEYERHGNEPINYYKYVIDKENFASTVENMFYCSFLIRDGRAMLEVDDDGIPNLIPKNKTDLKAFRNEKGVNVQMITNFTMEDWHKSKVKEGYIQRRKKNCSRND